MAAIETSWLIGSFTLASNATIVCNGSNVVITAGDYYLRDATNANSLIYQIQTGLAAVVGSTTVHIGKDRYLRIVSGGGNLTLTIPSSLQEVTGLAGSPTVGTTVTATSISTLLWSPGWPETPVGFPTGRTGRRVYDRKQTASPTGLTTRTTLHHYTTVARWRWQAIDNDRVWTTSDDGVGGEYRKFWQDVLLPGENFKLYPEVSEDSTVTTTVTWPTALGPYVASDPFDQDWFERKVAASDEWVNVELAAHVVSEISN